MGAIEPSARNATWDQPEHAAAHPAHPHLQDEPRAAGGVDLRLTLALLPRVLNALS
jgi:hypothetical protein